MILVVIKQMVKYFSDRFLGWSVARTFHICRVCHQCKHTFLSKFTKSWQVNCLTKDRCVINLKISGMHDDTGWCIDRKCSRIRNRMCRTDELDTERTKCDHLSVCYDLSSDVVNISMFTKLMLDQSHRQLGCVNRHIHFIFYIRNRTDMILMSVRDYKSLYLVRIFL